MVKENDQKQQKQRILQAKSLNYHQHHPRKMMAHHFMKVIDLARDFGGNQSLLENLRTSRVLQSVGRENSLTLKIRWT
jgi:hypothetical protein